MAKAKTDLVIVESPAKARTIEKHLGNHYQVVASMGHLRDLPKSTMGVDIDGDFTPQYLPVKDRADVIADLIAGFTAAQVPDYQMAAFLMAVWFTGMTAAETAALTDSMLEKGQENPILVRRDDTRKDGTRYVLVEGLHRLEACKALGDTTIKALLVQAR